MAWLGVLAVIAYAYGLGAASVIVWRIYRGSVWRYGPGLATLSYYALALSVAPPPAYRALRDGTPYAPEDVARNWASALAFGLSLLLLTRRLPRGEQ